MSFDKSLSIIFIFQMFHSIVFLSVTIVWIVFLLSLQHHFIHCALHKQIIVGVSLNFKCKWHCLSISVQSVFFSSRAAFLFLFAQLFFFSSLFLFTRLFFICSWNRRFLFSVVCVLILSCEAKQFVLIKSIYLDAMKSFIRYFDHAMWFDFNKICI